ncbi:HotDog domain-containing protein [Dunaliella salina]|uniref:HotDog domain-containing protein n=1 Tax=Dunaliella salina TaxID=3046 RepID=A0ABQ7H4R2_DUNSA|nr:HotDog domain-containing protein [Dunaliella salina]|eukprot:KAF5841852.1 HotDog domain-containing protein [Dunaliella salina]
MHQIVLPSEVDSLGICFGGQVLSWIDVCAGMSAKTLAKASCVTASVDAVHFLRPCRLGTVVIVAAQVNRTFNSSMEVGVRVESEDMKTGARYHCCSAYLTFVVVADRSNKQSEQQQQQLHGTQAQATRKPEQKPVLPRVVPSTKNHAHTFEAAQVRRMARLTARAESRSNPTAAAAAELCRLQPITHREGGPTLPPSITLPAPLASPSNPYSSQFGGGPPSPWPGIQLPQPDQAQRCGSEQRGLGKQRSRQHHHHHSQQQQQQQQQEQQQQLLQQQKQQDQQQQLQQQREQQQQQQQQQQGIHFLCSAAISPVAATELAERVVNEAVQASVGESNLVNPDLGDQHARERHACMGIRHRFKESAKFRVSSWGEREEEGDGGKLANCERSRRSSGGSASSATRSSRSGELDAFEQQYVTPNYTVAYVTQSIMPQHANTLGITFGGQVMSWMEQCAYISASRLRASHILTAAMDSVSFAKSTKVGDILYVTSQVTAMFMSSLEVLVSVHGEDPQVGELFHCADAFITLVTVSRDCGQPMQLPFQLQPVTDMDRLRQEGAQKRRIERLRMRAECANAESGHVSLDGSTW